MHPLIRPWLFVLSFVLFTCGLRAEEESPLAEYNDLPIKEIRFIGNDDVADDLLCNELSIGEGDNFDHEHVEKSRLAILDLDKFSVAEIDVNPEPDGIILTYMLKEKWHVMSVPLMGKKPRSSAACQAKLSTMSLSELEGLTIEAIRFEGNKTTRDIVLRSEIVLTEGDIFSVEKMIQSRQGIKNLGLFKMVWVRAEPGSEGAIITFTVSEKWYILPLPTLSRNTDGDVTYGGELTWYNTFGLNHTLELEVEQEDQADGETEQSASLDYEIPKIFGTPYGMATSISRSRTLREADINPDENPGTFYEYIDNFAIGASRWFKRISPSQGWLGGFGTSWTRTYYKEATGSPVLEDEYRSLNFGFNAGYTAVNDFEFYRSGQDFGADINMGRKMLGSTDDYTSVGFYWHRFQPMQVPVRANLNMQVRFGFNLGQSDVFELGGASSMRGILDNNKLIGDTFALMNLNWLIPIPRYPAFRWNIFTDVGNAWERGEVDLLQLQSTYGVGARWKLRQLVNISLRLDLGYNPNTGEYKFYAGTSSMF